MTNGSSTAQKVWTTLAHLARWGMLLVRTDPEQPKHKGMTYFVVDMQAPGVEVRPLRQITGEAEFNEVFFTDVRIPDAERLGDVGEGWGVSMTTLMNERVAIGGSVTPKGSGPIGEALRLWNERADKDPVTRDRLTRLWIEAEVNRLTNLRAQANRKVGTPGPEGSVGKLAFAEANKAIYAFCLDLLGARGDALRQLRDDPAGARHVLRQHPEVVPAGPGQLHRGRHQRDHAQHPRRAGPRPAR